MTNDPVQALESRLKAVIRTLPRKMGEVAVNFALDNWKRQGFLGGSLQPWQPRRTVTKANKGKPIEVGTGRLRRSVHVLRANSEEAVVGSDVPYAIVQNNGFHGTVQVPAHERRRFTKERITGSSLKTRKQWTRTVKSEAGRGDVKAHERKMNIHPGRFLGPSSYLEANEGRLIAFEIMKAARST